MYYTWAECENLRHENAALREQVEKLAWLAFCLSMDDWLIERQGACGEDKQKQWRLWCAWVQFRPEIECARRAAGLED